MRDTDYTTSADFLKRLFGETLHKVELRACANERTGFSASVFTRDDDEVAAFCARHDEEGMGCYFGVCTRGDARTDKGRISGGADNVLECPALWVDIDCAARGISGDAALQALQWLPHPPTIIVNSGGGLHAYWVLEEPLDVSPGQSARDAVVAALRALAGVLAGDMSVAEIARIMRLPGTLNSKPKTLALYDGQPALCHVVSDSGAVHDFDTLTEWLGEQRAVLHGRIETIRPVCETDPFVVYARSVGFEPSIDVDAALAAMRHEAGDDTSIHATQLRVSASMIARGYDDDEIVDRVLRATEAAAPRDVRWNWAREEAAIRKMVTSGRAKGYADKRPSSAPVAAASGNTALKLVHSAEPEAAPRPKSRGEAKASPTVAVGQSAIGVWQDRHGPVMHVEGDTFVYEAGVWLPWDDRFAQRLRAIIQEACAALQIEPKTAILNAARAFFMDRPELYRNDVRFDALPLLVAADATINLSTLEISDHSPAHYATKKVGANLHGDRGRGALDAFLRDAFSDRPEATEIIATIQEWFGASIAPLSLKTRNMLKGMFVHGPSRTGKTQLSELKRYLLGHVHCFGGRMSSLEDRFGLEGLIGKRGWIADDAVGEGETIDAEAYKVIVTGEATSARRRGKVEWNGRFGIPVMLTMNNIPRVRDQSDATYNRSLMVPMTRVRGAHEPEPAGFVSIAHKIGTTELTGLLWWAIEGWQRLAARRDFAEPEIMRQGIAEMKADNNPVGAWMAACVDKTPLYRVARADLVASFQGWRLLEHDDERGWKANTVTRRLRNQLKGHEEPTVNGERYIAGIALNEEGLAAWTRWKNSRFGENIGTVGDKSEVNKLHQPKGEEPSSLARTRF